MPISSTSYTLRVLFLHTAGTRSMFPCYPRRGEAHGIRK